SMGNGLALACLQGSDAEVSVISRRMETVQHGVDLIENGPFGLRKAVQRGKLTEEQAAKLKDRLSGTTDYKKGLGRADLVFESIPEVVRISKVSNWSLMDSTTPCRGPISWPVEAKWASC
ncbi:MAG: hypothetical protein IH917_15775, partial [Acidobacteria bacterium]|nr:hypothetical protein [Acidobacteriota bacterium]